MPCFSSCHCLCTVEATAFFWCAQIKDKQECLIYWLDAVRLTFALVTVHLLWAIGDFCMLSALCKSINLTPGEQIFCALWVRRVPGLYQSMFSLMASSPLQVVALNKRSKEAESAFLGIYKQLIEAPGESPTKTWDVHLHKQQQQQQQQHKHRRYSWNYLSPSEDHSPEINSLSLDQPSKCTHRDISCICEAKSNFPAIDRYGGTVYDIRCIKPYSLWLLSVFQSLRSQSGFQNSAWGHFKTQHWSLSAAWLRSEHILEELCCWLWRAN